MLHLISLCLLLHSLSFFSIPSFSSLCDTSMLFFGSPGQPFRPLIALSPVLPLSLQQDAGTQSELFHCRKGGSGMEKWHWPLKPACLEPGTDNVTCPQQDFQNKYKMQNKTSPQSKIYKAFSSCILTFYSLYITCDALWMLECIAILTATWFFSSKFEMLYLQLPYMQIDYYENYYEFEYIILINTRIQITLNVQMMIHKKRKGF